MDSRSGVEICKGIHDDGLCLSLNSTRVIGQYEGCSAPAEQQPTQETAGPGREVGGEQHAASINPSDVQSIELLL